MPNPSQPGPYLPTDSNDGRMAPPRYSTLSVATLPVYPTAGELDVSQFDDDPSPLEGVPRQAFDFLLERKESSAHGQNQAWATLRLFNTGPAALQRPRYTGGERIEGIVSMSLKRPQVIHSISVVLKGQMLTSSRSDGAHTFIEVVTPIWDNTMSVPRPSTDVFLPPSSSSSKGRLQGQYAWPFSIPFPTEFPDSFARHSKGDSDDQAMVYPTPQTVCQRGINANVQYEVTLKINTSGLFSSKQRVSATVLYVPLIRAPPLPPLRAGAYLNSTFLIGPEDDPTGWQAFSTFQVHVATKQRGLQVAATSDIECTAYIANPTTYTRGTVIPCYMVCKTPNAGDSTNALLNDFVAQKCVSLTLLQRVHYFQDPRLATSVNVMGTVKTGQSHRGDRRLNTEEGGVAVWWTPQTQPRATREAPESTFEMCLEGEIHVDVGLLPTCSVPFLEVSHDVCASLRPSQGLCISVIPQNNSASPPNNPKVTPSIESNSPPESELASFPVKIVTAHASAGPVPTPFTPRPARKKKDLSVVQEVQYMKSSFAFGDMR